MLLAFCWPRRNSSKVACNSPHRFQHRWIEHSDVAGVHTIDFNANDVGFVPSGAGPYVENTGKTDPGISRNVQGERVREHFPE